jgi:hypothetical protein
MDHAPALMPNGLADGEPVSSAVSVDPSSNGDGRTTVLIGRVLGIVATPKHSESHIATDRRWSAFRA